MTDKPSKQAGILSAGLRAGIKRETVNVTARLDALSQDTAQDVRSDEPAASSPSAGVPMVLNVADLDPNPYNPRVFYNPESLDAFALGMKRDGQHVPIKVTTLPDRPGRYVIVDGERRVRAKRLSGEETVLAELNPTITHRDLYLIANQINKEREPQTIFDDAVAWRKLLTDGVYKSQDELAEAVGTTKPTLSKIISLNEMPERLLARMAADASKFGIRIAYSLRLLYSSLGEDEAEKLIEKVIEGAMSAAKLDDLASRARDTSATRRRTKEHYNSRVQFANSMGENIGELKLFLDGRTEFRIAGVTGSQQEALSQQLAATVRKFLAENPVSTDSEIHSVKRPDDSGGLD